jgi:RimJ/RimL family protein N-acetyltransferase
VTRRKITAYALPEDATARVLLARSAFRAVGTLEKHVSIEGTWRNVVLYEQLLLGTRRLQPSIDDG